MKFKNLLFERTQMRHEEYKHSKYVCTIQEQEGLFVAYHELYMLILKLGLEQEYAAYTLQSKKKMTA